MATLLEILNKQRNKQRWLLTFDIVPSRSSRCRRSHFSSPGRRCRRSRRRSSTRRGRRDASSQSFATPSSETGSKRWSQCFFLDRPTRDDSLKKLVRRKKDTNAKKSIVLVICKNGMVKNCILGGHCIVPCVTKHEMLFNEATIAFIAT